MDFQQKYLRRFWVSLIRVFTLVFLFTQVLHAQNLPAKPNPPRLVNDLAHLLSADQQSILENKLTALDDSTSNQIAIVTIPTLDGYPIEDYANKLFRSWGIGNKKTNNGVLVLVASQDHQMRIEVGYGLEGAIPDITASDIIAHVMTPYFKQGNYYMGLEKATDALSAAAAGEYHVARQKDDNSGSGGAVVFLIILIVVILIILKSRGGGNGGGNYYSRRGSDILSGMILGNLLGGGGRSSGGGDWGGSSGGGGFGGFGGGSSGGGGASGGW